MKARRVRVPLGKRCVEILQSIENKEDPEAYIFPGWKSSKSLSNRHHSKKNRLSAHHATWFSTFQIGPQNKLITFKKQ